MASSVLNRLHQPLRERHHGSHEPPNLDSSGRVIVGATRSSTMRPGSTFPDGTFEAKQGTAVSLGPAPQLGRPYSMPPSFKPGQTQKRKPNATDTRRHTRRLSTQRVAKEGAGLSEQKPTPRHHKPRPSRPQSEWSLARCPAEHQKLQRVLSSKMRNHPTDNAKSNPG